MLVKRHITRQGRACDRKKADNKGRFIKLYNPGGAMPLRMTDNPSNVTRVSERVLRVLLYVRVQKQLLERAFSFMLTPRTAHLFLLSPRCFT